MSGKFQVTTSNSNIGCFLVLATAYLGLIGLFAWQTSELVIFLFPDDQWLVRALTVFSFDGCAALWGAAELFYKFAHPHSRSAVRWGWAITNILSLVATILYMVIQFMLRFQVTISPTTVTIGDAISIAALVFNMAMFTAFVYYEVTTRWHREDDFYLVGNDKNDKNSQSNDKKLLKTIKNDKKGRKRTDEQFYLAYEDFLVTGISPWEDRAAYVRCVTRKFGYKDVSTQTDELVHE